MTKKPAPRVEQQEKPGPNTPLLAVQLNGSVITEKFELLEEDLNEGNGDGKPSAHTIARYYENDDEGFGRAVELRIHRAELVGDKVVKELCPVKVL